MGTNLTSNMLRADITTRFKIAHKRNEKYTEGYVLSVLQKMYKVLATDLANNEIAENPVHANNIKFQKELCMIVGIRCRLFEYFKEKYFKETVNDKITRVLQDNPYYNEDIRDLIDKIQDICECRLIYSGTAMDMFMLRKHYGFKHYGRKNESTKDDTVLLSGASKSVVGEIGKVTIISKDILDELHIKA